MNVRRALVVTPDGGAEISAAVEANGLSVMVGSSISEAMTRLRSDLFDVVLIDLACQQAMDGIAGISERYPETPLVAVAEPGEHDEAARSINRGAFEWMEQPITRGEVSSVLKRAQEWAQATHPPSVAIPGSQLLGRSKQMSKVRQETARLAASDATVLILGENGTGKELVAHALHEQSRRRGKPFVVINLAAVPPKLVESEIFGYVKGAFTDAVHDKPGRVEVAGKGTLLLDEIGEASLDVQAKLLRLIESHEFLRLGDVRAEHRKSEARILAATHRDLPSMVDAGTFREDLYYRLNVALLRVPPLRARVQDIAELATWYVAELSKKPESGGYRKVNLADSALSVLAAQPWPGNVRQLLNLLEGLVLCARGPMLTGEEVREALVAQAAYASCSAVASEVRHLSEELQRTERHALEKALKNTQGKVRAAARLLNMPPRTLYGKIKEHGLEIKAHRPEG